MNNRVCDSCGWVYPPSFNEPRCRFCGTRFKERFCPDCGQLKVPYSFESPICADCARRRMRERAKGREDTTVGDRVARYRAKHIAISEERYRSWLELITAAPFKPLTEEQWLAACRYFGGCALCNNSSIDSRSYFIPYKVGGRYTAWNILPLCEKCETDLKIIVNPFRRMNTKLTDCLPTGRGLSMERVDTAAKYLQDRLKEVQDE